VSREEVKDAEEIEEVKEAARLQLRRFFLGLLAVRKKQVTLELESGTRK